MISYIIDFKYFIIFSTLGQFWPKLGLVKVFFYDFALHICWKLFWKGSFCFHQPFRRQV